jgi:aldose 1-epimerase
MTLRRTPFGTLSDGREIEMLALRNSTGIEVMVITYGAIITAITVPDRNGHSADIVLGHDNLDSYIRSSPYFGAVIGRYANRIGGGRFSIDGKSYSISKNENDNCLHGGIEGFDKAAWNVSSADDRSITLTHTSPDGDQGFPGELTASVTYTLADKSELAVDYEATTTSPTALNLTQHTYWNLTGAGAGDILDHEIEIAGHSFTPVDESLIPTGEMREVNGTPFDFQRASRIGSRIADNDDQLRTGLGYDHNFILDQDRGPAPAVTLTEPLSGRTLWVHTDQPGVQLYTGNRLDGTIIGKQGLAYRQYGGLCLETQHFPDSPNRPEFPSTTLRPGDTFRSRTVFTFGLARHL